MHGQSRGRLWHLPNGYWSYKTDATISVKLSNKVPAQDAATNWYII